MNERCPPGLPPGSLPPPVLYRLLLVVALSAASLLGSTHARAQESASPSAEAPAPAPTPAPQEPTTARTARAREERAARRAEADAERERDRPENAAIMAGLRMSALMQFGVLGQMKLDPEVDDPGDIRFSYGLELRITYPIARYLVAGGSFAFRRFRTDGSEEDGYGRSTFFQATPILQPRIPITLRNGKLLELAITIPIGLGITSVSQGWEDITGGAGLALGGLGSIQYFIAPRLMWTFEAGWIHQFTWHGVEAAGSPDDRTRMSSGQLVLRVGLGLRI